MLFKKTLLKKAYTKTPEVMSANMNLHTIIKLNIETKHGQKVVNYHQVYPRDKKLMGYSDAI